MEPTERVIFGYLGTAPRDADAADDAVVIRGLTAPRLLRSFKLGTLDFALFEGDVVDIEPHHRPPQTGGHIVLGYVAAGTVCVSQNGRTVRMVAGQFTFYGETQPFRVRSGGPHRYLLVRIPQVQIGLRAPRPDAIAAVGFTTRPAAAPLSAMLGAVADQEPLPEVYPASRIADAVVACVHAVLVESDPALVVIRSHSLFTRLSHWIEENLAERNLCAATVAKHHYLSTRQVRRVFADHGTTVSGYVRGRRLERIRTELLDPAQRQLRVGVIASRWGYPEPSVFSRAFSRRFGVSPERYRRIAGDPDASPTRRTCAGDGSGFKG